MGDDGIRLKDFQLSFFASQAIFFLKIFFYFDLTCYFHVLFGTTRRYTSIFYQIDHRYCRNKFRS